MRIIDIAITANQSFSVTLDGNRWDFVIKQAVTSMIADVTLNDVLILSGIRIVAGTPIIPYEYLHDEGNFLLLTENDDIPYWEQFGIGQQLVYASFEEIQLIETPPIQWPVIPPFVISVLVINPLAIVLGDS